jgi:hypothetical protein
MSPSFRRSALAAAALATLAAGQVSAVPLRLQPDEATSKDVFVYQFDIPGFFGIPTPPRTTNLDSDTLNMIMPPPVPFGNFLGASETDPFRLTPDGPLREHGTRTLIQFDLSSVGLTPAQVRRASLNVYALPALGAFESPTAEKPVTTDLRRVTDAWGETTATWENRPGVEDTPITSFVQSGVDEWISFDVSDLVREWLEDQSINFGVQLSQRDVVELEVPGMRDRYFASLYASSAFGDPALRPYLEIAPVPVPAALGLMLIGTAALGGLGLRRSRQSA